MTGFVDNRTKKYCANTTWLGLFDPPCEKQCEDCIKAVIKRQIWTKIIIKQLINERL